MGANTRKNYRGRLGVSKYPADPNEWMYDNDTLKEIHESLLKVAIESGQVFDQPPSVETTRDNYFKPSGNMSKPHKPKGPDTIEGIKAWQKKMAETLGPDNLPLYRRPDGTPGPIDGKFGDWSKAAAAAYATMQPPTKEALVTEPPKVPTKEIPVVPPEAAPAEPGTAFRVGDGTPDVPAEVKEPRPGEQIQPRVGDGTPTVTAPKKDARPTY